MAFRSRFDSILIILLAIFGINGRVYANQGFYCGGQLGNGKPDYGNIFSATSNIFPTHHASEDGLATRFYLGYQINPYFGFETGYTLFSDNTYKAKNLSNKNYSTLVIQTETWDILATMGMPFKNSGLRSDIKMGAAYVSSKGDLSSNILGFNSAKENNWDPAAGISFSYYFNSNFSIDISTLHIFGSPDISKNLHANADLNTLGVKYLFH